MSNFNILIADNDPDALSIYGEYLQSAGYNIFKASSVDEARHIVNTQRVHLVILDLRLTDDSPEDKSGLLLAQEIARSIPKLILTKWPAYEDVRAALKLDDMPLPPAVDFLDKKEGLNRLGDSVKQALLKYVRINQDLVIQSSEDHPNVFLGLFELLSSGISVDANSGAQELEDLFRQLFYDKTQAKIERFLWKRGGRVALTVFTFAERTTPESLVVVCGHREQMELEERRYREFAPQAPGHKSTVLNNVAATAHFGAHAYVLAGANSGNHITLADLYRTASDQSLRSAFSNLFDKTLSEWHQEKLVPVEGQSIAHLYSAMLRLPEKGHLLELLEDRFTAAAQQLPSLGVDLERKRGRLTVNFGGDPISYPDPVSRIAALYDEKETILLAKTPGKLLGSNILADRKGQVWLTDFIDARLGPVLGNHVALESIIRFDCVEVARPAWLHDMELLFTGPEFIKLYATEVEAPLRKTVRTIQVIRRLASRWVGKQARAYHLGVLFHAINRIVDYVPPLKLTNNELTRLGHQLFASAVILEKVAKKTPVTSDPSGIQIDHANKAVWIDGVKVQVRGQSYDLLHELYLRANELCSRREIVERVFKEKYEETNTSQASRLNTAIRRIREKIEEDPNQPRFLLTEPHGGYRLVVVSQ